MNMYNIILYIHIILYILYCIYTFIVYICIYNMYIYNIVYHDVYISISIMLCQYIMYI